jgi:regulator of replication initiation timing
LHRAGENGGALISELSKVKEENATLRTENALLVRRLSGYKAGETRRAKKETETPE